MELRAGYKNTEIGVIPLDWEVKELGDITKNVSSGKSNTKNEIGNFYLYGSTGVIGRKTYFDYSGNRILIARVGANAGSLYAVNGDYCVSDNTLILDCSDKLNLMYSYYFLKLYNLNKLVFGSGQPLITGGQLKSLQIPLPPLPEQKAIAEVLSDTDELIHAFEKRISKKRNIKQGAMQKLLTPKEGWETKKLGDFGNTFGGLSGKSKSDFVDGEFPYIPFMNIMTNPIIDETYFDYVNIKSGDHQNTARKGDLFFNGSSETPKEVGMCSVLNKDIPNLYLNSFCFGFRFFKNIEVHSLYLVYFLRSGEGRNLVSSLAQGSTRINISKKQLLKLSFKIPKIEEQKRIATILSDMDKELKKLEDKLDKYKDIKQGLMQQLLTGKIRLV